MFNLSIRKKENNQSLASGKSSLVSWVEQFFLLLINGHVAHVAKVLFFLFHESLKLIFHSSKSRQFNEAFFVNISENCLIKQFLGNLVSCDKWHVRLRYMTSIALTIIDAMESILKLQRRTLIIGGMQEVTSFSQY